MNAIQLNAKQSSLERLESHEFIVDKEEFQRLQEESKLTVSRLRDEADMENQRKSLMKQKIKDEMGNSMETTGRALKAFKKTTHFGKKMHIQNYSIAKLGSDEATTFKKVRLLRNVERFVAGELENSAIRRTPEQGEDEPKQQYVRRVYCLLIIPGIRR